MNSLSSYKMYKLIFNKSKSKNFEKALVIAKSFGAEWNNSTITLFIPDNQLLDSYEKLLPLFNIIQNWKSTRAEFNKNRVNPYKFILSMKFIKECATDRMDNDKNCWLSEQCQGWSCKKISNVSYRELGNGNYKSNNRYWYNFGHFRKNQWIVDKEYLYKKLLLFAEKSGLYICPYFDKNQLELIVQNLPNEIIPNDIDYRIYYSVVYANGQELFCPENIRHIPKGNQNIFGDGRLGFVIK